MSIIQIPFSGFKTIELARSVNLELYQALYDDKAEPVGMVSVIQAFGLLKPTDAAIDTFNGRWKAATVRWKLKETGIEIATGKGTTTGEMAKTNDGEVTLMILSFLLDSLLLEGVNEMAKVIIDSTPQKLVPIKPRRAQINNLLKAVQSQVSGVSWREEMVQAEHAVGENQQAWSRLASPVPPQSFEVPMEAMSAYYQALCTVTRFPENFHCSLETNASLALPFALAQIVCGLHVCVLVDGQVIHGNSSAGMWQVKLEKRTSQNATVTKVKLGRKVEDVQDLLVVDDVGPARANKIPLKGIGKASTLGQGLSESEAEELASLAAALAARALMNMKREVSDYSDQDEESVSYGSASSAAEEDKPRPELVPVQTQVSHATIVLWWDCPVSRATKLLSSGIECPIFSGDPVPWEDVTFGKQILGKIAKFESLSQEEQVRLFQATSGPCSRDDYVRLLHMLTSQIILISFLDFNDRSVHHVRVRSGSKPYNTPLGRAINGSHIPKTLGQTDAIASWYYWLKGSMPKDLDRIEVLSVDGFLVYRSLLLDVDLTPQVCEKVIVEPGHVLFEGSRFELLVGTEHGYLVTGSPRYIKQQNEGFKLKPSDKSGTVDLSWNVSESDGVLELGLQLKPGDSITIYASVYSIAMASWKLLYGGRTLGCTHGPEASSSLIKGESIREITPGNLPESDAVPNAWRSIKLYRAHGNNLGQVASLMSAEGRGMVKGEACLRCCLSAAQEELLDFLID